MIYVKVNFENGDSLKTGINATLEEAKAYYIGRVFNLGVEDDVLTKGVSVDLI